MRHVKLFIVTLAFTIMTVISAFAACETGSSAGMDLYPASASPLATPMWCRILSSECSMLDEEERQLIDRSIKAKRGAVISGSDKDAGRIICKALTELQISSPNDPELRVWYTGNIESPDAWRIMKAASDACEERAIGDIIAAFPSFEAPDKRTRMQDICRAVRQKIRFNYDATYWSMSESLQNGYGVCAQQATCAYVLANWYGIPCRLVYGTRNNRATYHCWVEVEIDGQKIPFDPCMFENGEFPDGLRFTEIDSITEDMFLWD